jgi:hypothetical protein
MVNGPLPADGAQATQFGQHCEQPKAGLDAGRGRDIYNFSQKRFNFISIERERKNWPFKRLC